MKPIYCIILLLTNFALAVEPDDAKMTFEDFNFDGHPDKKVFVSRGGGSSAANEEFEISIYNPETKIFEHNDQLSNLCNPNPDAKKKEIHSYVKNGLRGGQSEVYVWKGKDLVLTERIRKTETGPKLIVVTERLVDGKLIVISSEIEDAESNQESEQDGGGQHVAAADNTPEGPQQLFSAAVSGKIISVFITDRPFDPALHKITELIVNDSGHSTSATIDGRAAIGTDGFAPRAGRPQLAQLYVQFGDKRVDVPERLLTHVFNPSLGPATFDHRRAETLVSVSADGKAVFISLGVGDGGGATTYSLFVGADGTCTTETPARRGSE